MQNLRLYSKLIKGRWKFLEIFLDSRIQCFFFFFFSRTRLLNEQVVCPLLCVLCSAFHRGILLWHITICSKALCYLKMVISGSIIQIQCCQGKRLCFGSGTMTFPLSGCAFSVLLEFHKIPIQRLMEGLEYLTQQEWKSSGLAEHFHRTFWLQCSIEYYMYILL